MASVRGPMAATYPYNADSLPHSRRCVHGVVNKERFLISVRNRPLLQRVHARAHRDASAVHALVAEERGGVQQRVSEREAGAHRVGHRVSMDVGGDAIAE